MALIANELRIGNWISFPNGHKPFKISKEDLLSDRFWEDLEDENDVLHPIPLTSEKLEKCGFGGTIGVFYTLNSLDIDILLNTDRLIFRYGFRNKFLEIQYLHQLQNLYFDLTGTELEVNL